MPVTVVLAVGLDTTLLEEQISDLLSAGLFITSAGSIREAIVHFKNGEFDLVLLGRSIPCESRERLTFLLRSSGSRVPVVCATDTSSDCDSFVDATIKDGSTNILDAIKEIMGNLPATYAQSSETSRVPI